MPQAAETSITSLIIEKRALRSYLSSGRGSFDDATFDHYLDLDELLIKTCPQSPIEAIAALQYAVEVFHEHLDGMIGSDVHISLLEKALRTLACFVFYARASAPDAPDAASPAAPRAAG